MKKLFFINNSLILVNLLIAAYTYTTYYGFLGGGDAEMEKFLIIPIFVAPIFIITFIINIIINIKFKLSRNEFYFPIYSLLVTLSPVLLGACIDFFLHINILPIFMLIGNIVSFLFIILSVKVFIKRK